MQSSNFHLEDARFNEVANVSGPLKMFIKIFVWRKIFNESQLI